MIYIAPRLIGDGVASVGDLGVDVVDDSVRLTQIVTRRLGDDLLYTGKVVPCSPV
jgi:riboflavin biosynthesis pyrimidine reductase